jgi:polysaccharide pyruvyl transferase CsaB
MKTVFLFGYYGYDNLGDDLILESIVNTLNNQFNFKVLTYNYEKTHKVDNVVPVSRSKFTKIIREIITSDIVASGGGSLLQDATSSKSLYFYLGLIILGKLFRKETIFLFNGIGPIKGKFNKKLVKWVLNKVDRIILRDYQSKEFLTGLGITINVEVVGDAVFLNDFEVRKSFQAKESSKLAIISLRPWKHFDEIKVVEAEKLINALQLKGYTVELLPLMMPDDYEILSQINTNNNVKIIDYHDKQDELFQKIESAHVLIGERLHSLVISSICETPFIGIEYDPKIAGYCKMVKQINALKTENFNHKGIIRSLELLDSSYKTYYNDLKLEKNNIKSDIRNCVKSII